MPFTLERGGQGSNGGEKELTCLPAEGHILGTVRCELPSHSLAPLMSDSEINKFLREHEDFFWHGNKVRSPKSAILSLASSESTERPILASCRANHVWIGGSWVALAS